ncbi:MAG: hypothetical protein KAT90_15075 [Gammaproteobacteria bacterium]|nr:hypothetical protein [Gammaproteobacteria bacterium]
MSILTPAMQAYRDELAASNSNCKVWFPCDDGSGTTFTDAIGGIVETDASAAHNEPHSITLGKAGAAPTSGTYPALKENFVLVISQKVVTSEAFMTVKFGTLTNASVTNGIAACDYGAGSGNEAATPASALGAVDNDVVTTACSVIGDTLYHYGSINGAGITQNGTADASGFVAAFSEGDPTFDNASLFASTSVRQDIYGVALFTFDNGEFTTAEIIAALDEIDGNWSNGKKYLPSSIL